MSEGVRGSAEFSPCGEFRHRLDRWTRDGPRVLVCMANPSRAGADENDPTINRLNVILLSNLSYAGYTVTNWSDYIATDPDDLHRWREAKAWNEPDSYKALCTANLDLIRTLSEAAALRIIAWGNIIPRVPHTTAVLRAVSLDSTADLYCLGLTKDGSPKHPMARGKHRIPDDVQPIIFRKAATPPRGAASR